MSTFEYTTLLVVGCPLAFVALVVATVLIIAWKPDDGPMASDDPTEDTQDLTDAVDEILAVDPPVDRAYLPQIPAGMVLYRGGAVHPECAQRWLRFDLTPADGCAVWLTDDLKAKAT